VSVSAVRLGGGRQARQRFSGGDCRGSATGELSHDAGRGGHAGKFFRESGDRWLYEFARDFGELNPEELLTRINPAQLAKWQAFYAVSPAMGQRVDRLALELVNVLIALKGGKPLKGQALVEWR
jgi:hypothetical protein